VNFKVHVLNHKLWNDAMKDGPLEMQGFTRFSNTLFSRGQGSKVFHSLGNGITKETHNDPTSRSAFNVLYKRISKGNVSPRYATRFIWSFLGKETYHIKKHLVGNLFQVIPVNQTEHDRLDKK